LQNYLEKKNDEGGFDPKSQGAYGNLKYDLIMSYLFDYIPPEDSLVLDLGLDPGIYSTKIAQSNRRIIIGDISERQLASTRERYEKNSLIKQIEQFTFIANLADLSNFQDNTFDMVYSLDCLMSYSCEFHERFFAELLRITKSGAPILFTVKNKIQYFKKIIEENRIDLILDPIKAGLWELLDTNYKQFEEYPNEPAYYAFTNNSIIKMISKYNCDLLHLSALPCVTNPMMNSISSIRENDEAWSNVILFEKKISTRPGIIDGGDEILVIVRKSII